jgi:hypothetical protein
MIPDVGGSLFVHYRWFYSNRLVANARKVIESDALRRDMLGDSMFDNSG